MKYNYLAILFLLIFSSNYSYGTHYAGADISYQWLANNSQGSVYRIIVTIFRDCRGIPAFNTIDIGGRSLCNNDRIDMNGSFIPTLSWTDTLLDGRPNGSQVGGFCPGNLTTCSGTNTTLVGYEEWRYEGQITLPSRCANWHIWVDLRDRNGDDNLNYGIQYPLHLEAMINNIDAPTNASPYFTVKPTPYVCVNEEFTYGHGAVDPTGDSISYESYQPMGSYIPSPDGNASPVPYMAGFNVRNPFPTANGYHMDQRSGQTTFTPTQVGKYTTAVRVFEWRNGKIIGSVTRDIQTVVRPCTTQKPKFKILPPTIFGALYKDSVMYACQDIPFRFCFAVNSTSKAAKLIVSDNHRYTVKASSVSYLGQKTDSVTGCFFWRPTAADIGYRVLTIIVRDSSCSLSPDVVDRSYSIPIVVRPAGKTYQRFTICPDQSVQLQATYPGDIKWSSVLGSSASSLSCTNCFAPTARPDSTSRYLAIQDMGGGCINADTVDVIVDNSNSIAMTPSGFLGMCVPGAIQLSANAYGLAPLQRLSCGIVNTPATTDLDSAIIYPSGASRAQNTLNAALTPFNGQYTTGRRQYLLRKRDLRGSGIYSGTLKGLSMYFQSSSSSATYDNVRIAVMCTKSDTLSPRAGFLPGSQQVYAGTVVIPAAGGWVNFDFNKFYNRDTAQNLVVEICYTNNTVVAPAYTAWTQSNYAATLYAESSLGDLCTVVPSVQPFILEPGLPLMRLSYYLAPSQPFSYAWTSTKVTEFTPSATVQNPSISADRSQIIYVSTVGRNGCKVRDSLDVYVAGTSKKLNDTAICIGNSFRLDATVRFGKTYKWYENSDPSVGTLDCNNCPTPLASPKKDVTYSVVIEDSIGCIDTMTTAVIVKTTDGQVNILNGDTTINYGSEVQLQTIGASRYEWDVDPVLSEYNIPDPVAKPDSLVRLRVTGYTEGGCKSYDSVLINVDYKGKIFIPDAFTPNGDGKNDVFRVVNFTFQELLEFRVFNRWGAEIFNTTDGTQGWDGTYKGTPQEIGTYFYVVRVRFKDNTTQRFVGDVTLIR